MQMLKPCISIFLLFPFVANSMANKPQSFMRPAICKSLLDHIEKQKLHVVKLPGEDICYEVTFNNGSAIYATKSGRHAHAKFECVMQIHGQELSVGLDHLEQKPLPQEQAIKFFNTIQKLYHRQ